jgi:hypothetical protein
MPNATYQSPVIAAPNLATKRLAAYDGVIVLLQHIRDVAGGYNMDIVSLDFGITTAQRITFTTSAVIPPAQLAIRFPGVTQTA